MELPYLISNVVYFILGALVGSFLNVICIRLPKNLSIITPRSHCIACKKNIPIYLNIPIISYILLKGKCYNCKSLIPRQYLIIETLTGILFFLIFSTLDTNQALLYSIIFSCLIIISTIDMNYLLIPSKILLILFLTLILKINVFNDVYLKDILIGAIFVTAYLGLSAGIAILLSKKKNVIGLGDILLSLFIGGWLGIVDGMGCLFISSIIGLIIVLILKKQSNDTNFIKIPFGLCISASFILLIIIQECFKIDLLNFTI